MALPVYQSSGNGYNSSTLGATHQVERPATVNTGDFLLLQCCLRTAGNDGAASVNTANWTAFPGNPYGGTNSAREALFWKFADSDDISGGTVEVAATGGTTGDGFFARISRFTGVNVSTPVVAISTANGAESTTINLPTVTPTGIDQLAVCGITIGSNDTSLNVTGETGGDWVSTASYGASVGGHGTVNLQTSDQSGGGQISGGSVVFSGTFSNFWTALGFALAPAADALTQAMPPDAILASTNLSGAVGAIDEDPTSPAGDWLTATSATSATDVRVSFGTPPGPPRVG